MNSAGQKIRAVMAYNKNNTLLIQSKNDMDIIDLYLKDLNGSPVAMSVSDRNNVRIIEHEFTSSGYYYFSIQPRQLRSDIVVAHISFEESGLTVSVEDLEFNGTFSYSTIGFYDNELLYRNKLIYVVVKKHGASIITTPVQSIGINNVGTGLYTPVPLSVSNFGSGERIEILVYSDSACQNLITRQHIQPMLFSF